MLVVSTEQLGIKGEFLLGTFVRKVLDGSLDNQPPHQHASRLTDAMRASLRLQVIVGVPGAREQSAMGYKYSMCIECINMKRRTNQSPQK
jgi:hypothetical protein